ncbi:MAG: ABC transporter permease, partial [Caulobacterales bacterium]|nr:ABC transporter permease [Caulobacterales bacterium]
MGAPLRIYAIFAKELIQMRRDRLTFAIMLVIPVMQLILFGYAINNDPRQLPTAVHLEERTPL